MSEFREDPNDLGGLPSGLATIDLDESITFPGADLTVRIESDETSMCGNLQVELIDECGMLVLKMSVESRSLKLYIPTTILEGHYSVRLSSGDWILDAVPLEITNDQAAELTQCLLKASLLQADALAAFELPKIDIEAILDGATVAEELYLRADGPRLAFATWQRVAAAFSARGMAGEAQEATRRLARLAARTADRSFMHGISSPARGKDPFDPLLDPLLDPSQHKPKPMTRIVVVAGFKAGVGRTTTSASFASGLALRGHKTAVIDFDVGLRNLDLIMGFERRVVFDLINVIHGDAELDHALIKDRHCDNLFVLAASQTRDKDALTQVGVEKVLNDLSDMGFEYIVCDSPAGFETGAHIAMHFADEALIVTNAEVSSVCDSDRILGMLSSKTSRAIEGREPIKEHLLITRYSPARAAEGQMLSYEDIQDILRIKLIGVIPESENVLTASIQGVPAIHLKGTEVAEAYSDVIERFLGAEKPLRFVEAEKAGFFKRVSSGGKS